MRYSINPGNRGSYPGRASLPAQADNGRSATTLISSSCRVRSKSATILLSMNCAESALQRMPVNFPRQSGYPASSAQSRSGLPTFRLYRNDVVTPALVESDIKLVDLDLADDFDGCAQMVLEAVGGETEEGIDQSIVANDCKKGLLIVECLEVNQLRCRIGNVGIICQAAVAWYIIPSLHDTVTSIRQNRWPDRTRSGRG